MQEGWTRFVKYALWRNELPSVLKSFPSAMAAAFGVRRPSLPATIVIDVDNVEPEMSSTDVIVAAAVPTSIHSPFMTITISVCNRRHSSTVARLPKNLRLNTALETGAAVMKEENVLDVTKAAVELCLLPEAAATQKLLP